MKKTLQLLNIFFFAVTIYVNYASAAGVFGDTTQATMSAKYPSLFTPAGYAFSIWGLIYLLLFGFIVFQARSLWMKVNSDDYVLKTGWWFIFSCIANSLWCYLFVMDYIFLSVFVIFFLLFCLLKIIKNNEMKLLPADRSVYLFLWLPFIIYGGWLTVACIANVTTVLIKINWGAWGISPTIWTLFMIGIATSVNLLVTWRRNLSEFALVGAWALTAISVANWEQQEAIKWIALTMAGLLVLSAAFHMLKRGNKTARQQHNS